MHSSSAIRAVLVVVALLGATACGKKADKAWFEQIHAQTEARCACLQLVAGEPAMQKCIQDGSKLTVNQSLRNGDFSDPTMEFEQREHKAKSQCEDEVWEGQKAAEDRKQRTVANRPIIDQAVLSKQLGTYLKNQPH